MINSAARRLDAVDERLARIERLQKELRVGITDVAEEVRVAAEELRRGLRIQAGRAVRPSGAPRAPRRHARR